MFRVNAIIPNRMERSIESNVTRKRSEIYFHDNDKRHEAIQLFSLSPDL